MIKRKLIILIILSIILSSCNTIFFWIGDIILLFLIIILSLALGSVDIYELHEHTFNVEKNKLQVYQDLEGEICVKVKTIGGLNRRNFLYCQKYFGNDWLHYVIEPANSTQMWVTFYDIPNEFFEKLDLEMKTNKFNV